MRKKPRGDGIMGVFGGRGIRRGKWCVRVRAVSFLVCSGQWQPMPVSPRAALKHANDRKRVCVIKPEPTDE